MPILATYERNDARGAARLLAIAAKDCIDKPAVARDSEVVLNNTYRLLEGYRANTFSETKRETRRRGEGAAGSLTLMPPPERHLNDVRLALDHATRMVFADIAKDEALIRVENVLRWLAYPENFERPTDDDRNRARRFFDELLRGLSPT